jgi:hypothetical protein
MSGGLDFSGLTDDQIVELASALAHEALMRNPAVAAAFQHALLTAQERAEAAVRGAQMGKARQRQQIEEIHRRAAEEQGREELRQRRHAAVAGFVRRAAQLVGRDPGDVTLVWMDQYGNGHRLYLNAGTSTEGYGAMHLVDYTPQSEAIRVSWALDKRKADLLVWAREAVAALRALSIDSIFIKGIEL